MAATEYLCTVKSFKMLTPTVFELTFDPGKDLAFKGGQFISIVIPGAGPSGRDLRRAYSIASPPESRPIELCIKLVEEGPGTNYLYKLRPGDTFRGFAPYGDFVYKPKAGRHACMISTGTGIAPFRSMIFSEAFKSNPPEGTLCLLGVRTVSELLYLEEMNAVTDLRWVTTVSQPESHWAGFKGRVTDFMRSLKDDHPWQDTEFYLCGNGAMITEMKLFLADKGVAKEAIHQEVYYK